MGQIYKSLLFNGFSWKVPQAVRKKLRILTHVSILCMHTVYSMHTNTYHACQATMTHCIAKESSNRTGSTLMVKYCMTRKLV
jgi:hypothetical protein